MPQHLKPYANVLETIGWTPLIRLQRVTQGIRTPVYAKAEQFNPGGSVKDRIGLLDERRLQVLPRRRLVAAQ